MRIHLLSDLHLEFGPYETVDVDTDVVVLAGDTWQPSRGNPARMIDWAADRWPDVPVLMVAGNHDYWKVGIGKARKKYRAATEGTNVRFMDRDEAIIGGVQFLGATLWTDYGLQGDPVAGARASREAMNDFRYIRVGEEYRKARPTDLAAEHVRTVRWLQESLARPFDGPTVILTHHAPSARSLSRELADDAAAPAYASNLDALAATAGVSLWLHGHTHHPVDYTLGDARVVSNPRGYVSEPCVGFEPDLLLEL